MALALNWTWNRTGGAIQSEPLFLLLGQLSLLGSITTSRGGATRCSVLLGGLLAGCMLTRQVGIALACAVLLNLLLERQWIPALVAGLVSSSLIAPWLIWVVAVHQNTQAELLAGGGLPERVAALAFFYVQRLPDLITGPFVEIATVFRRSGLLAAVAIAWAIMASVLIVAGWVSVLKNPRRQLAALVAAFTLSLLLVWPFTEAGRFLIPLLPCVLIGATEGLAIVARRIGLQRPHTLAAWLILTLTIPYSLYALGADRAGALRRTHSDFDAACRWIALPGNTVGPILTRHPGEVYWQTGRRAIAPGSGDLVEIDRLIEGYGVAYLLVDEERYANAPPSLLSAYVAEHPERVRQVWARATGPSSVAVFQVVPVSAGRP